jgi:uncharacterized RDD family membrane protein YckC
VDDQTDVLGRRIGAALLDLLVLVVVFVVVGLVFGESDTEGSSVSIKLEGGPALLFFALVLLYYGLQEAASGRTLGKRALGLRVVSLTGGDRPTTGRIAGRTILRVIDILPILYLVGFIAVLATGERRQRLGDLAAGTTVRRG